jgi:hypothetical protein
MKNANAKKTGGCLLNIVLICGIGIAALAIVGTIMGKMNPPPPNPQAGWAAQNSAWDASVHQVVSYLKSNLNDPGSYEGIEWSPVQPRPDGEGYMVRHRYRARNGFGALTVQQAIFYMDDQGRVLRHMDM